MEKDESDIVEDFSAIYTFQLEPKCVFCNSYFAIWTKIGTFRVPFASRCIVMQEKEEKMQKEKSESAVILVHG